MFDYRKIFGYYRLSVPLEKGPLLLNRLNEKGIYFFGAAPQGDRLCLNASIFSCTRVIDEATLCDTETELLGGVGLPFFLHRYRKRFGIYIGIFLSCIMLLMSQLFVWKITVSSDGVSEETVLEALRDNGIYVGAFIPDIRVIIAESKIAREADEISSIAINLKGTVAEVDAIKRVHPPYINPSAGYGNIIASDDGVIMQISASSGKPCVSVGERVSRGQLLISGDVTTETGFNYKTLASGNVFAAVERNFSITVPLCITQKHYTGRTYSYKSLTFIGRTLFGSDMSGFELYDAEVTDREIYLFGLDTAIRREEAFCREYEYVTLPITVTEAKERCIKALKQYLSDKDVYDYSYTLVYDEKKGACTLNADTRIIEDISYSIMLPFSSPSASESNDKT